MCIERASIRIMEVSLDSYMSYTTRRRHFSRKMAGGEMLTPFFRLKRWLDLAADTLCHRTTGMKATTAWNINGTW